MLRKRGCSTRGLAVLAVVLGLAAPALAATTATLTVGGAEQQVNGSWDHSTLTISFNGYVESVSYGQFSSPASVAAAIAGMFTRDYASDGLSAKANCPPNNAQIIFTLQGTTPFGALDIQGPTTSFSFTQSGFQSTTSAVSDYGTVMLTVNGLTAAMTNYGAGATPASIAEALAASVTSDSPVTVRAVNDTLYLEAKTTGPSSDYSYSLTSTYDSSAFSQPSFPASSGNLDGGADANTSEGTIYSYSIPSPATSTQGYNPNGTILGYTDSVTGSWSFTYDNLNRLATAVVTPAVNGSNFYCWSYDAFGNREQQMGSNEAITGGGESTCTQTSGANVSLAWANYSTAGNNRMTSTSQAPGGVAYDVAGDITNDGKNQYLYNANGQICAVEWTYNSLTIMTGYIYDADGNRVAKGSITSMSCDPSKNGFVTESDYVRDQSGNQLSEFTADSNGNIVPEHTNVWANGTLMATDDINGTHFFLNDWLGTRRVMTDYAGAVEQRCMSLPYGDGETCPTEPTENLFTGKERDQESGLDNFVARYYSNNAARFMSPDPSGLAYATPTNPQSLNLYSYVENNPLEFIDPTGLRLEIDCLPPPQYEDTYSSGPVTDPKGNNSAGKVDQTVTVTSDNPRCNVIDNGIGDYHGFIPQVSQQSLGGFPVSLGANGGSQSAQCTALQKAAAQVGDILQRTSEDFGMIAAGGGLVTVLSGVGEAPSGGLDTGLTLTAGSVTALSADAGFFSGLAAASLHSFANGNFGALNGFNVARLTGLATTMETAKIPFVGRFAETLGYAAEQVWSIQQEAQSACQ